jgi:hypothetical protein
MTILHEAAMTLGALAKAMGVPEIRVAALYRLRYDKWHRGGDENLSAQEEAELRQTIDARSGERSANDEGPIGGDRGDPPDAWPAGAPARPASNHPVGSFAAAVTAADHAAHYDLLGGRHTDLATGATLKGSSLESRSQAKDVDTTDSPQETVPNSAVVVSLFSRLNAVLVPVVAAKVQAEYGNLAEQAIGIFVASNSATRPPISEGDQTHAGWSDDLSLTLSVVQRAWRNGAIESNGKFLFGDRARTRARFLKRERNKFAHSWSASAVHLKGLFATAADLIDALGLTKDSALLSIAMRRLTDGEEQPADILSDWN